VVAHEKECKVSVSLIASRVTLAARETGGAIGIVENVVEPGWPGPPLHHHAFDETFCILEGELTFQVGADRRMGRAGDTLFVVRGVRHTLANLSGGSARYLLVCTPGGFEQRFGPDAGSTPSGPNTDVIVVGPRIPEMDAKR
jgi:quercetin dioxygenase-like cupin family protein